MPNQKKFLTVDNLAAKFKQAKGLILTDYSGLKVDQINQLRAEIKKVGGEYEVIKNTLLTLAAKNNLQFDEPLSGPTAALWLYNDDPNPIKALDKFAKESGLPKVKLGFWQGAMISKEKISELASLPSLDELHAKLIGNLLSPISGLANALNWNINKLILVLKAKSEGGDTN